ncbi:MAG: sporulation protein YtfJ [Clostridia bacterium]|nr:sporulation protein YtfJ [Clostridia bacterium]MBO5256513.1 sporulation protein YtfJ [Clostridia bacterium]
MAENNTNKLGDITKTSLESIRSMLDANTIIGDPIETASGTCIIPISKISVGYASGGVDYLKKDAPVSNGKPVYNNFGGGGGTGITVTPVAFLVVTADGNVNILNINAPAPAAPTDAVSQVVGFLERSPDLIDRIKGVLSKKNEENNI